MVEVIAIGTIVTLLILVFFVNIRSSMADKCAAFSSMIQPQEKLTTIAFDDFIKWYSIAPERWNCYEDSLQHTNYSSAGNIIIPVKFNLKDYHKYMAWFFKLKAEKEALIEKQKQVLLLEQIQKDIEKYKKENMPG